MGVEYFESLKFLGFRLIDFSDLAELIVRFALNTAILLLIVRYTYLKHSSRCNYTFSFMAVGGIVFLLCFLLNNVKLELGFALGLFAIFGIIRYRTDAIPFKQMTYLFVVIGVSVMNALASKEDTCAELLFTNLAVLALLWILEKFLSRRHESFMPIVYENISNVHVDKYDVLLEDLKARTGYNITHFEIEKIDYLQDTALINIYFSSSENSFTKE